MSGRGASRRSCGAGGGRSTTADDRDRRLRRPAPPLELIADVQGPLSRKGVAVRRQLERTSEAPEFRVELPLRLLIVVSRPADLGFIDPRLTTPAVLDALETLGEQVAID